MKMSQKHSREVVRCREIAQLNHPSLLSLSRWSVSLARQRLCYPPKALNLPTILYRCPPSPCFCEKHEKCIMNNWGGLFVGGLLWGGRGGETFFVGEFFILIFVLAEMKNYQFIMEIWSQKILKTIKQRFTTPEPSSSVIYQKNPTNLHKPIVTFNFVPFSALYFCGKSFQFAWPSDHIGRNCKRLWRVFINQYYHQPAFYSLRLSCISKFKKWAERISRGVIYKHFQVIKNIKRMRNKTIFFSIKCHKRNIFWNSRTNTFRLT